MNRAEKIREAMEHGAKGRALVWKILELIGSDGRSEVLAVTDHMKSLCGSDPDELVPLVLPARIVKLLSILSKESVVRFYEERHCESGTNERH